MSLTKSEVEKIAHLARISLSEADISQYTQDLSKILDLVDQMNQVNTTGITPMAHPFEVTARLRQDEVTETDRQQVYQQQAPSMEAGLYLVPKVIE